MPAKSEAQRLLDPLSQFIALNGFSLPHALITALSFSLRSIAVLIYALLAHVFPLSPPPMWDLHPDKAFEGYYTRLINERGGSLIIIFSRIRKSEASRNPNLLHLSYIPGPNESHSLAINKDWFPDNILQTSTVRGQWKLSFPGLGAIESRDPEEIRIWIRDKEENLHLNLKISGRTPWEKSDPHETTEGVFAHLDHLLPQHWHVNSTCSRATYNFSYRGNPAGELLAIAHLEKNFGSTFPTGWIWVQSFSPNPISEQLSSVDSSSFAPRLVVAGGYVFPGVQAYLVGFRGRSVEWDFKPLRTLVFSIFGKEYSWGASTIIRSEEGTLKLVFEDAERILEVEASANLVSMTLAPKRFIHVVFGSDQTRYAQNTFHPFACPLPGGHVPCYAHESFVATSRVIASKKITGRVAGRTLASRQVIEDVELNSVALEFGGSCSHWWKRGKQMN